jgi:hypothetical protein
MPDEAQSNEASILAYADRLYGSAMNVMAAATGNVDNKWNRDPKIVGLTMLARSLSIFNAALILVRANQVMEARMLARPLYEVCLWIAALREKGAVFIEAMVEDDILNRKSLGQTTVRLVAQHGGDLNNAGGLALREIIRDLVETNASPKKLHADKVAEMGVVGLHYVDYNRLSLDSLHCSVTAIARHVKSERVSELQTVVSVNVEPKLDKDEAVKTVLHLCRALLCVAITANELLGNTSAGGQLTTAMEEYEKHGWATLD